MREFKGLGAAPDLTNAFLVSFGFLVFCCLVALWAMFGYLVALGAAALGLYMIKRAEARRQAPPRQSRELPR